MPFLITFPFLQGPSLLSLLQAAFLGFSSLPRACHALHAGALLLGSLFLCSIYTSEIVQAPGFPSLCSGQSVPRKAVGLRKCGREGEEELTEDLVFPSVSPGPRPPVFL